MRDENLFERLMDEVSTIDNLYPNIFTTDEIHVVDYCEEDCEDCEDCEECEECEELLQDRYQNADIKEYCDKSYPLKFEKGKRYRKNESELFIGFEVEFELPPNTNNSAKNELARTIKKALPNFIAECKHDGSLNNGFEAVSHPIHISKIMSADFKKQFNQLVTLIKSRNGGVCNTTGLHFHVNNKYLSPSGGRALKVVQTKLVLLSNIWYRELQQLSGRFNANSYYDLYNEVSFHSMPNEMLHVRCGSPSEDSRYYLEEEQTRYDANSLFSYCLFMPMYEDDTSLLYDSDKLIYSLPVDHSVAINCNSCLPTTEFRFFAGTLDFDVFFANIELVIAMCRLAVGGNYIGKTLDDILKHTKSYEYYKSICDLTKTKTIDYAFISERQRLKLMRKETKMKRDLLDKLIKFMGDWTRVYGTHMYFMRDRIETIHTIYATMTRISNSLRRNGDTHQMINYDTLKRRLIFSLYNQTRDRVSANTFQATSKERKQLLLQLNDILEYIEKMK